MSYGALFFSHHQLWSVASPVSGGGIKNADSMQKFPCKQKRPSYFHILLTDVQNVDSMILKFFIQTKKKRKKILSHFHIVPNDVEFIQTRKN